jgi:hypothetical protein
LVTPMLVFDAGSMLRGDVVCPFWSVLVFSKPVAVGTATGTVTGSQPSVSQSYVQLSVHSSSDMDLTPSLSKLDSVISMWVKPGTTVNEGLVASI